LEPLPFSPFAVHRVRIAVALGLVPATVRPCGSPVVPGLLSGESRGQRPVDSVALGDLHIQDGETAGLGLRVVDWVVLTKGSTVVGRCDGVAVVPLALLRA